MINVSSIDSIQYQNGEIITFKYPCGNEKTSCYPYTCILSPGRYLFEVFGAEGGKGNTERGGLGGYSKGIFITKKNIVCYLYIGAQGLSTSSNPNEKTKNAFNGGGIGINSPGDDGYYASSGGGGTDIRALKDDIYHRIIVAGGAGGGSGDNDNDGGGYSGKTKDDGGNTGMGNPATMKGPGEGCVSGEGNCKAGKFGYGGNQTKEDGAGGGGGWYGGASGSLYMHFWRAAGGGSGFVFTAENTETAKNGKIELKSLYYLKSAKTQTSDHKLDGEVKITVLSIHDLILYSCKKSYHFYHFNLVFIIILK